MEAADDQTKRLMFRDLSKAAIDAWIRYGFSWQEMVDGFGGGSDGLGMPPLDDFRDLARDAVQAELSELLGKEECRLMRSRLYQKHQDVELHYGFTHGNHDCMNRDELLWYAVWNYLCSEMERQYAPPSSLYDFGDEDEPEQLSLAF